MTCHKKTASEKGPVSLSISRVSWRDNESASSFFLLSQRKTKTKVAVTDLVHENGNEFSCKRQELGRNQRVNLSTSLFAVSRTAIS
jgi:hypothetical protein